jgi:alpha-tubulin suppressor-like RCC1 family protein
VFADSARPELVPNLSDVKMLGASGNQTCALTIDGSLFCWGDNENGLLGDGALLHTGVPAPVPGL